MSNVTNQDHPVLLFDGHCNLCNGSVQWIIRRDPEATFRFASLQSDAGRSILRKAGMNTDDLDTVVLYYEGALHTRSDAALKVLLLLGPPWSWLYPLSILPRTFRNTVYDWIARNRYRWFGRSESCMIPSPELKARFLD